MDSDCLHPCHKRVQLGDFINCSFCGLHIGYSDYSLPVTPTLMSPARIQYQHQMAEEGTNLRLRQQANPARYSYHTSRNFRPVPRYLDSLRLPARSTSLHGQRNSNQSLSTGSTDRERLARSAQAEKLLRDILDRSSQAPAASSSFSHGKRSNDQSLSTGSTDRSTRGQKGGTFRVGQRTIRISRVGQGTSVGQSIAAAGKDLSASMPAGSYARLQATGKPGTSTVHQGTSSDEFLAAGSEVLSASMPVVSHANFSSTYAISKASAASSEPLVCTPGSFLGNGVHVSSFIGEFNKADLLAAFVECKLKPTSLLIKNSHSALVFFDDDLFTSRALSADIVYQGEVLNVSLMTSSKKKR